VIPLSRAEQIREMDRRVIRDLGLPGPALMELAADAVVRAVLEHHASDARRGVAVVCGPGNNGGDGYAVARRLRALGLPVVLVPYGTPAKGSDAAVMAAVAAAARIPIGDPPRPGLWVDALFGTGLSRELDAGALALVARMNDGAPVVAVDLPSGLCGDTGRVWGNVVRATRTVTFGRQKLGMWLQAGPEVTGAVEVADLGLGVATRPDELASAVVTEASDLSWPSRARGDHKARSGHLLVVAGSAAMAGAAVLCCRGALAAGAGLVTLAAPDGARPRLGALPPEVMVLSTGPGDTTDHLPVFPQTTALVVGPGLGGGRPLPASFAAELAAAWASSPLPLAFDADALPCTGPGRGQRVLTPHPGEAARLLGRSAAEVDGDRLAAATRLAERGVALLKGPHTVVAAPSALPSLNPTGNPVLATGGSGDVLAGVVGALLARGVPAGDAARAAAWVHGRAGDLLAAVRAEGWTAGDVADALPRAIAELGP
jgi:hydroxyethylthiazole kinase-like uncharacterized protein yjeF